MNLLTLFQVICSCPQWSIIQSKNGLPKIQRRDKPRILSWGGAGDKREKKFKYASI